MDISTTCNKLLAILDEDPVKEHYDGKEMGKELLYTQRLLKWVKNLSPEMSDELRVATCGHHIYRWQIPRDNYPMDRQGYNEWRMKLMFLHANETAKILKEEGYSDTFINRVKQIILKRNFRNDPEVQIFEDAINLTFLEYYMVPFAKKHAHEKLVSISKKILAKMSDKAIRIALELEMPEQQRAILTEAMN